MNAPSPWLRPLQALAAVLGVAIAALFVVWVRMEPTSMTVPDASEPVATPDTTPASLAAEQVATPTLATPPAATAATNPPDIAAPEASAVLYGTVKGAQHEPIARGFLWLTLDGRQVGTAALQKTTYVFAGLRPGTHRLTSRIDDQLPIDRDIVVEPPATRLDLVLEACHVLTVHAVTPDGVPLTDALQKDFGPMRSLRALAFVAPLAGDLPPSDRSELEGGLGPFRGRELIPRGESKAMPKQTLGVLTLPPNRVVHVALLLGTTVLAQQPATAEQDELTFVLAPEVVLGKRCAIRVRFVNEAGTPVADAPVSLSTAGGTRMGGNMRTDAEGRYQAKALVPGLIGVGVRSQNLISPSLQFTVPAGADVDLGDIVVRAAVEVEFAMDNFGERGGVWLSSCDARPGTNVRHREHYLSRDNGSAQKASLYPGRYTALATSSNGAAVLDLDTAALPSQPIRFGLQPGAILQLSPASTDSFVRFTITTTRGAPLRTGELGSRMYPLTLPPGSYTATITDRDGNVTHREFKLPSNGTTLTIP